MSPVLDASVFIAAISPTERHHHRAKRLFDSHPDTEQFLVPELFRVEVIAGLSRRGEPADLLDTVDAVIRGPRFHARPLDGELIERAMGGTWYWHTETVRLEEGDTASFVLGKADIGYLSKETRRLRITIWWPEVNLAEGEEKAEIWAWIQDDGKINLTDWRFSSNGDPIRFDFDCTEGFLGPPPTGELILTVKGVKVPVERRAFLRDYRAVTVTWFWETGDDASRVRCSGNEMMLCGEFGAHP